MFNQFINKTWETENCFKWTKKQSVSTKISQKNSCSLIVLSNLTWKKISRATFAVSKTGQKIIENRPNTDTLF